MTPTPKKRFPAKQLDSYGSLKMVDVSAKPDTLRQATAQGRVTITSKIVTAILKKRIPKGNVFEAARLAGIMAAKKTSQIIPLCHPLPIRSVEIDFQLESGAILVFVTVSAQAPTGVEMEALTALAVACLTLYDMLKSFSHELTIGPLRLLSKSGGASGDWHAGDAPNSTP